VGHWRPRLRRDADLLALVLLASILVIVGGLIAAWRSTHGPSAAWSTTWAASGPMTPEAASALATGGAFPSSASLDPGLLVAATAGVVVPMLLLAGLAVHALRHRSGQAESTDGRAGDRAATQVLADGRAGAGRLAAGEAARPPPTRFADVAGAEEAKHDLEEVVVFLRRPARFQALGARIPRGTLLVGPPGTGKTLLARAVAGEAGVPFFAASGSEFVEMYVGVGARRVRDLFECARRQAPSIVFIDEIDAVGRKRATGPGAHEERDQTLNQLLVELDGFGHRDEAVIVLAATNRDDVVDEALLRPGRFDRRVRVERPDRAARLDILRVHARSKPLAAAVDLQALATDTGGLSGAELEQVLNEAAIFAACRELEAIGPAEIRDALDRVIAGPRKLRSSRSREETRITAYHEGGHALVGHALGERVARITISERGLSGGHTRYVDEDERTLWRRSAFEARLAALLGGQAAERLVLGEVTTGPSDDLRRASELARRMVVQFGMADGIGPRTFESESAWRAGHDFAGYGEATARRIEAEVGHLLERAQGRALTVLRGHRRVLEATAQALVERETLEGEEVARLFRPVRPVRPRHARSTPPSRWPESTS
jgi:cell division protease FtsH